MPADAFECPLRPEFRSSVGALGAKKLPCAGISCIRTGVRRVPRVSGAVWALCALGGLLVARPLGGERQEHRRRGDVERAQDLALGGGQLGLLAAGAGGPGEGAQVQALELVAEVAPGLG